MIICQTKCSTDNNGQIKWLFPSSSWSSSPSSSWSSSSPSSQSSSLWRNLAQKKKEILPGSPIPLTQGKVAHALFTRPHLKFSYFHFSSNFHLTQLSYFHSAPPERVSYFHLVTMKFFTFNSASFEFSPISFIPAWFSHFTRPLLNLSHFHPPPFDFFTFLLGPTWFLNFHLDPHEFFIFSLDSF